jgi:hypothetical protein
MKRSYIASMMVAATMLAGCRDDRDTTAPTTRLISPGPAAHQTLVGTVEDSEQRLYPRFVLRMDDGTSIGLDGTAALPLASVIGAQVQVDGAFDGDSAFEIDRFVVLAVGGTPVLDGVLEADDDGAYMLRLTTGGDRMIIDPPADLIAHIGERVWLTQMQDDGSGAIAFGVIRA